MQEDDASPDGDYDMAEEDPSEGEGEFEEDFDLASWYILPLGLGWPVTEKQEMDLITRVYY